MRLVRRRHNFRSQQTTAPIKGVSATTKKTRRRKMKKNWGRKPKAAVKKGFNAFNVQQTTLAANGKKIVTNEVVAPETGIHSKAWAQEIEPQSGLFSLPIELRNRIYEEFLGDVIVQNPRRSKNKYITSDRNSTTIYYYNFLTLICRQTYVDVVGGQLLYRTARFVLSSPETMTRYLSCINPVHRSAIRKVSLSISLTMSSPTIRPLAFTTLSSLPNLQSLKITTTFCNNMCSPHYGSLIRRWDGKSIRVRQPYVDGLIGGLHRWEAIKGLNDFSMDFQRFGSRWLNSMMQPVLFDSDDLRLVEIEEKVREMVTRRD